MKLFVLAAVCLVLGACDMPTPYTAIHAGKPLPPVPVQTADDPLAYDYLPAVLGGECSEAEYPLFAALQAEPVEQARPLLEVLGIIQDYKLVPFGSTKTDDGWMRAINLRQRLFWKKEFTTPEGSRVAWLFIRGYGGGNQGQRVPATALVSGADNQVIAFKTTRIWGAFKLRPVELAHPDATVLRVANRYEKIVDHGNGKPVDEFPPCVIRFSASGVEVTPPRDPREGFAFPADGQGAPAR